jgi:hypothetical protein
VDELERILKRKDLRSADRANMRNIHQKLRSGDTLSYQERQNLWAYLDRYGRVLALTKEA